MFPPRLRSRVSHGCENACSVSKTGTTGIGMVVDFGTPQHTATHTCGAMSIHRLNIYQQWICWFIIFVIISYQSLSCHTAPFRVSSFCLWVCSLPCTAPLAFTSQNQALVAQFLVFHPNQPPLAFHPIAPSQYLNPSVPHPNRRPSTPKQALPHFKFLVYLPTPAPLCASPNCTLPSPQLQCTPLK